MTSYLILVLILSPLVAAISREREARTRLDDHLATNQVLNAKLSPIPSGSEVAMKVYIFLLNVADVIESKQTIETNLYFHINFLDPDLNWNPDDFGNITTVQVPSERIWHPEIYITNSADGYRYKIPDPAFFKVNYTGAVIYRMPFFSSTFCDFDLTYYPLDSQTCDILVMLVGDGVQVNARLQILDDTLIYREHLHQVNGDWKKQNMSIETYTPTAESTYFKISVVIRRERLYYILCVILPMVVTSLLTLMVFWIPPESGEKMSYLISIYMSSSLFLGLVGSTLPRNMSTAEHMPRMTMFLVFIILEGVAVIMATVIVMRRYRRQQMSEESATVRNANGCVSLTPEPRSGSSQTTWSLNALIKLPWSGNVTVHFNDNSFPMELFIDQTKNTFNGVMSSHGHGCLTAERLDFIFFIIGLLVCVPFYGLVFIL